MLHLKFGKKKFLAFKSKVQKSSKNTKDIPNLAKQKLFKVLEFANVPRMLKFFAIFL